MATNCPKCNQAMEMYYAPWCPRCDKPQRKTIETLNLVQALRHIEAVTGDVGTKERFFLDGYKNRMWDWLANNEFIASNDCYVAFYLSDWWQEDSSEQNKKDVELFVKTFDIDPTQGIILDISW